MKKYFKIIFLVFIAVLLFSLVGCEEEQGHNGKSEDVATIKAWVIDTVGVNITEDITLPTTHPTLGGTITWFSTDPDVLDETGQIVERAKKGVDVDLGFTVSCGGAIDGDYITIHVSPITLEEAVQRFESILPSKTVNNKKQYFIARDIDIPSNYYNIISVGVQSSNEEIFTNDGKYTRPVQDTEIILTVTIGDSYDTVTEEFRLSVQGKTVLDVLEESIDYIDENMLDLMLTSEKGLITEGVNGAKITWKSSNPDLVSADGKVTEFPFERYVSVVAKVEYDGQFKNSPEYYCKVKALDTKNMSMDEKLNKFLDAIAVNTFNKMNFNYSYSNITQSYGFIYFYDGTGPETILKVQLIKDGLGNKPDQMRTSTQFITVHDTGNPSNGANAEMHARYIANGSGGAQTSWHFAVDDVSIYQHINDGEITWHAADGSRVYQLNDTGVKATMGAPKLSVSSDRYFVLGRQKTKIRIPSDTQNLRWGPYGIYTTVGANGNYWMNTAWYNTGYGYISNSGGNRNSVSMETCVHPGSDYVKTFMNACKLTTMLLRKYNLDCDRIYQHNNFCGKNCPQAIREGDHWAQFRDLCAVMKYGLDTFGDYKFSWTSNDTKKLTNAGYITLSCRVGDEISYSVKVTKNNVSVLEKTYTTKLA